MASYTLQDDIANDASFKYLVAGKVKTDGPQNPWLSPMNEQVYAKEAYRQDNIWIDTTKLYLGKNGGGEIEYQQFHALYDYNNNPPKNQTPNYYGWVWFCTKQDWLSTEIHSDFEITVYHAPPGATYSTNLAQVDGTAYPFVIDYITGVFSFIQNVPNYLQGLGGGDIIYFNGYRYTGRKGLTSLAISGGTIIDIPTKLSQLTNDAGYLDNNASINADKINSGTVPKAQLPSDTIYQGTIYGVNENAAYLKDSIIPPLDSSKVAYGTLNLDRIPQLTVYKMPNYLQYNVNVNPTSGIITNLISSPDVKIDTAMINEDKTITTTDPNLLQKITEQWLYHDITTNNIIGADNKPTHINNITKDHKVYENISVVASNVVADGSKLSEDIMPDFLAPQKTLISVIDDATPYKTEDMDIGPGVIGYNTPVEIHDVKKYYNTHKNYNYLLPKVQIYSSNIIYENGVAGGSLYQFETDKFYKEKIVYDYYVNPDGSTAGYGDPATTTTSNNLSFSNTFYPTIGVSARNVINDSQLDEKILPDFLHFTKTLTGESIITQTITDGPTGQVYNGSVIMERTSNLYIQRNYDYLLDKAYFKSENVFGSNLSVSNLISCSNLSVSDTVSCSNLKLKNIESESLNLRQLKVVGNLLTGSQLTITQANALNQIAGYLKVNGVSPYYFPDHFREFQCGQVDNDNQFSAEGDPGYGFFGGFTTTALWYSNSEYAFTSATTKAVYPDRHFKALSRFHISKAFDDSPDRINNGCYNYGWNSGNRVYPSQGYNYSIKCVGSIWTENKLLLSSDERIKENIRQINPDISLLAIRCLKPSGYKMKEGDKRHCLGFIAQEVKEFVPEAISYINKTVEDKEVKDFHLLDYNTITTLAVSAIQSLANQVIEMRKEIDELKSIINKK